MVRPEPLISVCHALRKFRKRLGKLLEQGRENSLEVLLIVTKEAAIYIGDTDIVGLSKLLVQMMYNYSRHYRLASSRNALA